MGASLFGACLRDAEPMKLGDHLRLRVRRANDTHARERLRQQRRDSMIEFRQLDTGAGDPPIHESQDAADRAGERQHEQRERPRNVAKRTQVEQAD